MAAEDGLELVVSVDVAAVHLVLESILLDVLPDLAGDLGARDRGGADDGGQHRAGRHGPHEGGIRLALRAGLLDDLLRRLRCLLHRLLRDRLLRRGLLRCLLGFLSCHS